MADGNGRAGASRRGEERTGICVSGGGVRAASFGLGALQALQERRGLLYGKRKADYLAAVSGGCYIAGAYTMLNGDYGDNEAVEASEPFAEGSPEVEHIRRTARYLVGGRHYLEAGAQVLIRLLLNVAFFASVIFLAGRLLGWLFGWGLDDLRGVDQRGVTSFDLGPILWLTVVAGVLGALGLAAFGLTILRRASFTGHRLLNGATVVLWIAGVVAVIGIVLPEIVGWYVSRYVIPRPPGNAEGAGIVGAFWGTVSSAAAAFGALRAVRAPGTGGKGVVKKARPWASTAIRWITNILAAVTVPFAAAAFFVSMLVGGATNVPWEETGNAAGELALWLLFALTLGLFFGFGNIVSWSLHPYYKRRLMTCFAIRRLESHLADERPYEKRYLLSKSTNEQMPELLICAAANVSGFGEAPAGQGVLPFVFSPSSIGYTSEPMMGPLDTKKVEESLKAGQDLPRHQLRGYGDRNCITLPAAVAMTGAAFSPSMGKMTMAPLRMLMTVLNLRLGVWIPNPGHPVIRQRIEEGEAIPTRPRPHYLFRELFGTNSINQRFVYVTDGGHYENLGLVELLRKECTRIWCVDASGDAPGTASTLTDAMLLAEAELGTTWTDSTELRNFESDKAGAKGRDDLATIRWPSANLRYTLRDGREGLLTVLKLGIATKSPYELRDYQRRHPTFPYDSTGNQLYRADRFDAYRALGSATTNRTIDELDRTGIEEPVTVDLRTADVSTSTPKPTTRRRRSRAGDGQRT
jgi:hypothetical protein